MTTNIKKTSKKGKILTKNIKQCEQHSILNTKTNRCVSKKGPVGQAIQALSKIPVTVPVEPLKHVKLMLNECENNAKWVKKKKLAEGSVGAVYITCPANKYLKADCEYVMKIQKYNDEFVQELKALRILNNTWIHAPKIYAIWKCKKHTYIIQEKVVKNTYSDKYTYNALKPILKQLHNRGIVYPDIHADNVMMRKSDGRIILIDYGWAVYFKTKNSVVRRKDVKNYLTGTLDRGVTMNDFIAWENMNIAYEYGTDAQVLATQGKLDYVVNH